jgi:hypothetical protein
VNIRTDADVKAAVMFRLQPGDQLKIIEKKNSVSEIDGTKEYWYRIDYKGKKGFVWGGLIADAGFASQGKLILVRNLGVKKCSMELRIVENGRTISRLEWKSGPAGSSDDGYRLYTYGTGGLKNSPDMMFGIGFFHFSEIEYGYNSIQLFTLTKNGRLIDQFSWSPGACDPPVCGETFVLFPGDTLKADPKIKRMEYTGAQDTIRIIQHDYDIDNTSSHEYSSRDYKWDGVYFKQDE